MIRNMRYSILFTLIFIFLNATAQVANYNFENNILDQQNGHDALYLENGELAETMPNFVTAGNSTELLLGPNEGIVFPSSLNTEIDTTQSLEIEFTFTITDFGQGYGDMDLWNCANNQNAAGFRLFAYHDSDSPDQDFEIRLTFADGGFGEGVPDHPGLTQTLAGYFFFGDVINVRLILDFETNSWTTLANGTYSNGAFDNEFDFNIQAMKTALIENFWHFGWHENFESELEEQDSLWRPVQSIDNLAFFSPRRSSDIAILTAALQEFTKHTEGSEQLNEEQLNDHLLNIYLNYTSGNTEVLEDVFAYINAYENNNPPIFEDRDRKDIASLSPEERLLFFLQQSVFDYEYDLETVREFEGVKFEFSNIFPGSVKDEAARETGQVVAVNGTHYYDIAARVILDVTDAKRPLGFYAPAGEIVSITLPPEMVDKGLSVLIGAHSEDVSGLTNVNRFHRISKTYPLINQTTEVVSPFGGGLYLQIPINSDSDYFNVTVDGAVRTPYFSWRQGRQSDVLTWAADLAAHNAEWVDIESDNYMMTLPLNHVIDLTDPRELISTWDSIMTKFAYLGGRPNPRTRAEYFLVDSQLPSEAFGTGYPQVIGDWHAPFGPLNTSEYYPTHVLTPEFWDSQFFVTWHEMGHAVFHPTISQESESIVHMPATYLYNDLFGLPIDDAFKYSSGEFLSMEEATLDWMISENFRRNNDMGVDASDPENELGEHLYQHRGFAKYVEMAKLFGWEANHNMNAVFYDEWTAVGSAGGMVDNETVLRAASVRNGINMSPLFHFWGHSPSEKLEEELKDLPLSTEIYDQLVSYYYLIPNQQIDFLPYRDRLLERKDPVHYRRINEAYDNYESEDYRTQMQDQICGLMEKYYPDSPTCSELTSSISVDKFVKNISVFPNPTDGRFTLSGDLEGYSISLISVAGKAFQKFMGRNGSVEIETSGMPSGIYFLQAQNSETGDLQLEKIIKVN